MMFSQLELLLAGAYMPQQLDDMNCSFSGRHEMVFTRICLDHAYAHDVGGITELC